MPRGRCPRRHFVGGILSLRGRRCFPAPAGAGLARPQPTRATLLDVLTALGARIGVLNLEEKNRGVWWERYRSRRLPRGWDRPTISGALAAQLIDELPVLAAIGPYTSGGPPHPRRQGTAREGVRPDRVGGKEPAPWAPKSRNLRRDSTCPADRSCMAQRSIQGATTASHGLQRGGTARRGGDADSRGRIGPISFPEFFELLDQVAER